MINRTGLRGNFDYFDVTICNDCVRHYVCIEMIVTIIIVIMIKWAMEEVYAQLKRLHDWYINRLIIPSVAIS